MKNFNKQGLVLALILSLFASMQAHAQVAVIVHKDNAQSINKSMIKRIFLSKIRTMPNGVALESAGLSSKNPSTVEFNKKVLKKSSSQMKAYWSKLIFTGTGKPTKTYQSAEEVIDIVKNNINAIGYIDSSKVSGDVRVIASF